MALHGRIQPILTPSWDLAYVLGCLKCDGCVYAVEHLYQFRGVLTSKDLPLIGAFNESCRRIGLKPHKPLRCRDGIWISEFNSSIFVRFYQNLTIPDLEQLVLDYPHAFLRASFECEGHYSIQRNNKVIVRLGNTDTELHQLWQSLIKKLGYNFNFYLSSKPNRISKKPCYVTEIIGPYSVRHQFVRELNPCIKREPIDHRKCSPSS